MERWLTAIIERENLEPRRATDGEREELSGLGIPFMDICVTDPSDVERLRENASVDVAGLSDEALHQLEEEVIAEIGRRG